MSTCWCGVAKCPSVAGMPSAGLALKPNSFAVDPSDDPSRCCVASIAKVVLHDTANAFSRLVLPRRSLSKLWNVRPPIVTVDGHCTAVEGRSPFLESAEAVTTLNVEPGGKIP